MALANLIKSANFCTSISDEKSAFVSALDQLKVETKEEVEMGFSALVEKLREDRITGDTDEGVYMGKICIARLMKWAGVVKFDPNQSFVDIMKACFETKLCPGQLNLICDVVERYTEVKKHVQTLTGKDLADFVGIFKTDYFYQNSKENAMEKRYYESLKTLNTQLVEKLCSASNEKQNVQQAQTASEAFAEAVLHNLQQAQLATYKPTAYVYTHLSKVFLEKFDRTRQDNTIYLKVPHLVKPHLKAARALILESPGPKFPKHKDTMQEFEEWIRALVVPIVETPNSVTKDAQDYVSLMFGFSVSKAKPIRELALMFLWKFKEAKQPIIQSVKFDGELLKEAAASDTNEARKVVDTYLSYFVIYAMKDLDIIPSVLASFAHILAGKPHEQVIKQIQYTIGDAKTKDKGIIFKNYAKGIKDMMASIVKLCHSLPFKKPVFNPEGSTDSDDEDSKAAKRRKIRFKETENKFLTIKYFFENMFAGLKKAKTLEQLNEFGVDIIVEAVKSDNHFLWTLAYKFIEVPWQDNPEKFASFLEGVLRCAETRMMDTEHGKKLSKIVIGPLNNSSCDAGMPLASYIPTYIKLAKTVENRDLVNDDDQLTADGQLLVSVLNFMAADGHDISQLGYLIQIPFKFMDHSVQPIKSPAETLMHTYNQQPKSMVPHMGTIIDTTLKNKDNVTLITLFKTMMPMKWNLVYERLDDILGCCGSTAIVAQMLWLDAVRQIADNDSEGFNAGHVDVLKTCMSQQYAYLTVFAILHIIAKSRPELLRANLSWMLEMCKSNPETISYVMMIIPLLPTGQRDYLKATVDELMKLMETFRPSEKVFVLTCIRSLALEDKSVIQPHVKVYESLKSNRECAEVAQQLIDIAKGRTAKELGIEVADQKVTLKKVEKDVVKNKTKIGKVAVKVEKQDAKISRVKQQVKKTKANVSELKSDVVELGVKVEEVDHKTMTNAPDWSRDVSLLLNKPSDADWRLLAQRLGYSNKDIRAWACQADPCMAVLSEWYANHKATEATFGVMKALEEMHCEKALKIVKKAAKEADNVVKDDSEVEITNPPPVFLSYQWGHQEEAKMLKEHLEAAGFRCWMDLGQMGGGDKLFAKIDAGMRSAAVVICCVTHKYAKSDNCNREVNLAVTVGKPIIPLLVEKMSWPPAGAMGPIFGEYLFIRFFARSGETVSPPEVFWPQAKLKELLFQLRFHIIPEEKLISKEYESWWLPPGQKLKPQLALEPGASDSTSKTNTAATQDSKEVQASGPIESPQIFLSYQWGRQSEVEMLFNKLTRLGYSCWMDIHQMGGGDSLYDKIDRGIRGCCVAVSCVTPKYSMSANCRKEITLAEALKKPIIPLMLDTVTWPPEGPMSMVLAPLAYIDCRAEVGAWKGQGFQSLLKQISKHIKPAKTLDFPDLHKVDGSQKPFDAKKQWRKVKNVSTAVSASQACHIL